ncbi:amino acid adenylation domain-containing protein [Actinoplanes sp. NPDC048967]|uniref:amino acid adenylation domain-containing protein n=1 Tax=Actinoplanes sp. NPDC048967 TaxID=3155269 RepID=UPI0034040056
MTARPGEAEPALSTRPDRTGLAMTTRPDGAGPAGCGRSGGVLDDFLSAAHVHADRPAIRAEGADLTYAELAARVTAFAAGLGAEPGVVGVPAGHHTGTVTALFGVWAAGGTYCPIDPGFPEQRRTAMARTAGCRVLIGADGRPAPGPGGPDPEAAYVLFTSGSTGVPKPVVTSHRAIATTVGSLRELFGITPHDRVLQFASLNWDTCFEEILPALTGGACLVFDADAHRGSFPRFLRMLARERITVLDLPTAFWHELVGHLHESGEALPACVRLVIIGGEAAAPGKVARWSALPAGPVQLLNTYGCTETTLITHALELTGAPDPVPIGRALPHVAEHLGEGGELLIGGPALADGYLGRPAATAERFVTVGGRRFFRTGDRVSRAADGVLTHRGRIDHEVKIRGIRVDPAEVEAHLTGHPAVRAALVTGVTVAGRTALAAYVVPRAGTSGTGLPDRIAAHLRGRVPAHLVPSHIHVVAELAYTASGKVDRRASKEMLS